MADLGNWAEENLLKWLKGGSPAAQPTEWNVALFDGDPSDGGSGTELDNTVGGYSRVTTAPGDWALNNTDDPDGWTVDNDVAVDFGTASADWSSSFDHVAIYEQNGNLVAAGDLDQAYTVQANESFQFDTGDLNVTLK